MCVCLLWAVMMYTPTCFKHVSVLCCIEMQTRRHAGLTGMTHMHAHIPTHTHTRIHTCAQTPQHTRTHLSTHYWTHYTFRSAWFCAGFCLCLCVCVHMCLHAGFSVSVRVGITTSPVLHGCSPWARRMWFWVAISHQDLLRTKPMWTWGVGWL